MTPEEVAELYLRQYDWTYEQSLLHSDEWGLSIWESWITEDPERAWPVFLEIVKRRRDDEMLDQVGHRLRLLLWRHWEAFHERAEQLVHSTPRFGRIVGDDFFERDSYVEQTPSDEAFLTAYFLMNDHARDAHRVRDVVRNDAARGLRLAVEIIHRGPRHGFGSFDTFDPLRDVLEAHGESVIGEVEEIARGSALVRRCLWRMKPRELNRPPREGAAAEVWRRAIAAHGTTTDFTDDDAPSPAPRTLAAEDEALIEAWFVYEENFWAFHFIDSLDAEALWPMILKLLARAEGQVIYNIAAGPLENLLAGHGADFIDRVSAEAAHNPKLREALSGVWLDEDDPVYERVRNLSADPA